MDARRTLDARTRERGTALIEFTLILPLLLLLTLAAVDLGRAFYVKNMVEQSAREGARLRVVTSSADSALVRSRVQTVLQPSGVSLTGLSIAGPDATKAVTVTVTVSFNWLNPGIFNLFGAGFTNPMTLNGKAVMRNEGAS